MKQLHAGLIQVESEQLTLLTGTRLPKDAGRVQGQVTHESVGSAPLSVEDSSVDAQVLDQMGPGAAKTSSLRDLEHPVTAYLNGLAPSSRRPQLSALGWIARRATQLYTAETMPWHRLRRPHVLKIRGLLEEHYQPATANRMLSALRGVLRECWQAQLITIEDYQAATSIPAVRGESEPRGRNLSAGELRSLFQACSHAFSTRTQPGLRCSPPARRRLPGPGLQLRSPSLRGSRRRPRRPRPCQRRATGAPGQGPQAPPGHPATLCDSRSRGLVPGSGFRAGPPLLRRAQVWAAASGE
jgi:hypothetical protein